MAYFNLHCLVDFKIGNTHKTMTTKNDIKQNEDKNIRKQNMCVK